MQFTASSFNEKTTTVQFMNVILTHTLKLLTLNKHVLASCCSFIFTHTLYIHKLPAKDRSNVSLCRCSLSGLLPRWIRLFSFLCGQRSVSRPALLHLIHITSDFIIPLIVLVSFPSVSSGLCFRCSRVHHSVIFILYFLVFCNMMILWRMLTIKYWM